MKFSAVRVEGWKKPKIYPPNESKRCHQRDFDSASAWAWPVSVCVAFVLSASTATCDSAYLYITLFYVHIYIRTQSQSSESIPCMCLVFTHIFISHHFSFVRPLLRSFCNNSRFFCRLVLFRVFAAIHTHAFYYSRKNQQQKNKIE